MKYENLIAIRHLRGLKRESPVSQLSLLSIIGTAVGVWALIVVMSVLNGFGQDLRKKVIQNTPQLLIEHQSGELKHYRKICQKIRQKIPEITHCAPYISSETMLLSKVNTNGAILRGISKNSPLIPHIAQQLKRGKIEDLFPKKRSGKPPLFLGKELAQNLSASIGTTIRAVSPTRTSLSPLGPIPKIKKFYLAGIIYTGIYEYDSKLAFTNFRGAQKLFKMNRKATGIELATPNYLDAPKIKKKLQKILPNPFLKIRDWSDINRRLFSALQLEKIAMFLILTLILLVASFSIISTLTMSIIERTSEISILKALGAKRSEIIKIFTLEGTVIGTIGTAVGLFLGWRTCKFLLNHPIKMNTDVYYIPVLPIKMSSGDFIFVALTAITISILAAIYPASHAAKLHPLEGLQQE